MENKPSRSSLPAETSVGRVTLRVPNLARALGFYESVLGLQRTDAQTDAAAELAATRNSTPLIRLIEDKSAERPHPVSNGLFHFAILVPSRADLGWVFLRLSSRGWRLDGVADHSVSEALYLSDADGNGIEIYCDRPRDQWKWNNDEVHITTEALDLNSVVNEAREMYPNDPGFSEETKMGHVHLKVSRPEASAAFYKDVVGLGLVASSFPGARFLSAGGYHHHLGLNNWSSAGAGPVDPHKSGLVDWELLLPDSESLDALLVRLDSSGVQTEKIADGVRAVDPDGIAFRALVRKSQNNKETNE